MVKLVQFMVRADGYDHEAFVERWRGEHAEMAQELPGLEHYSTGVPTDPERAAYDGVLELGFEDMAAFSEAFDSDVGQEVQADAEEFVDMDATEQMMIEETVHVGER